VPEWFCRKGIGEKLLKMAESAFLEKGENLMWLWVLESNARAIAFYEKHL
jgi:diamine N-acetyltransferase